jgi:hypothetical protein
MAFRASILIPKPIDKVFGFAVDQAGSSRWQYQVDVELLSGDANAPGSTYKRTMFSAGRTLVHTYELTAVARPFRFEVRSTSGGTSFVYDYTFFAEAEGTRVVVDVHSAGDSVGVVEAWLIFLQGLLSSDVLGARSKPYTITSAVVGDVPSIAEQGSDASRRAFRTGLAVALAGIVIGDLMMFNVLDPGLGRAVFFIAGHVVVAPAVSLGVLAFAYDPTTAAFARGMFAGVGITTAAWSLIIGLAILFPG